MTSIMTEMIDENKDTISVTSDLMSEPNLDTDVKQYVPSNARLKAFERWSVGELLPLNARQNGHKVVAKRSPKKDKKMSEFDVNSDEYKERLRRYKESIECVIKSDTEMDDSMLVNDFNGIESQDSNELNESNGQILSPFLNSFETFVKMKSKNVRTGEPKPKRVAIVKNVVTKRVKTNKNSEQLTQTSDQMPKPLTNCSEIVLNNCLNGQQVWDNKGTNGQKICKTDKQIKSKPKLQAIRGKKLNINSKISNSLLRNALKIPKSEVEGEVRDAEYNSDINSNNNLILNSNPNTNHTFLKKFVPKLKTQMRLKVNSSETQIIVRKRVKQLRGLKPNNIKIVRNRKRPLIIKGLSSQKSFLDFIRKKYPPIKEGVPFIQDRSCKDFTKCPDFDSTDLSFCLDCCDKRSDSQTCRFFQYRTLIQSNGRLSVYAFAEEANATQEDSKLWVPLTRPQKLDALNAKYLLTFIGDQLCRIYATESEIAKQFVSVTWKKPVKGIRELCDVCLTTIFNTHYVCPKCGFAVCIDCYDGRKTEPIGNYHNNRKNHDEFGWVLCHRKERHSLNGFHLALFFTKRIFESIDLISHKMRNELNIFGVCVCGKMDPKLIYDLRQGCSVEDVKAYHPQVPKLWLCEDRLLVLTDPKCAANLILFQMFWLKGYPVIIQSVDKSLKPDIWSPESFNRSFGRQTSRLVNCMNGLIIPKTPMSHFWDGFEDVSKRLVDSTTGEEMILKLKDWPPTEEFRDKLPIWFDDLMEALPLSEYTRYDGQRNLAARLPEFFVRPDLGPKMYCAYGSVLHPSKGTTNLHLDMSDAVNVMMYVGVAQKDGKPLESHLKNANDILLRGGCDQQMMARVGGAGLKVGALWHIWRAEDADKIRDFLHKVSKELGIKKDSFNDPIHDQSWYLDQTLRTRLETEYNVKACAIAQCLGDAILVPAGAPHQVQNIHSCIKVAGEFVSPENVSHCLSLTHEFRRLSKRHNNHEDKLQIKNIIYHTIKDSLAMLLPPLQFETQPNQPPLQCKPVPQISVINQTISQLPVTPNPTDPSVAQLPVIPNPTDPSVDQLPVIPNPTDPSVDQLPVIPNPSVTQMPVTPEPTDPSVAQLPVPLCEESLIDNTSGHNIPPTPPNSTEKRFSESTAETLFADSEMTSNTCDTGMTNRDTEIASNTCDTGITSNTCDSEMTSNTCDTGITSNTCDTGITSNTCDTGITSNTCDTTTSMDEKTELSPNHSKSEFTSTSNATNTESTVTSSPLTVPIDSLPTVPIDEPLGPPPVLKPFYESDSDRYNQMTGADTSVCFPNEEMATVLSNN